MQEKALKDTQEEVELPLILHVLGLQLGLSEGSQFYLGSIKNFPT